MLSTFRLSFLRRPKPKYFFLRVSRNINECATFISNVDAGVRRVHSFAIASDQLALFVVVDVDHGVNTM